MPGCPQCGSSNALSAIYCGQCGAELAPAGHSGGVSGQVPGTPLRMEWVSTVPLATDRFMLYDVGKVLFWTAVLIVGGGTVVALLMGGASEPLEQWVFVLSAFGAVLAGVALLFLLVMIAFFGNRYRARVAIEAEGVSWESLSRRASWSSKAAVVAGVLAGNPTVAGAGLLAATEQSVSMPWSEVRRIRCHPRLCVVSLMNGWRVVVRLYCPPTQYEEVCKILRANAPHARVEGDRA